MTKPTTQYVERALDRIIEEARVEAINRITTVHHQANMLGRLESGYTLVQSNEAMLALMKQMMKRGAQETFNALEQVTDENVRLVTKFSEALAKVVAAPVEEWARAEATGPNERMKQRMADELKQRLVDVSNAEIDDFSHGMHGGARLKKEPVVNQIIHATMTNSPGAVQQAGIGEFSQSAIAQQATNLIHAIDQFVASPEFKNLVPEQKEALSDVADVLKNEAKKPEPDPGKLQRWGRRLSDLTKEFGLHVAASGIWHALGEMFKGGPAF